MAKYTTELRSICEEAAGLNASLGSADVNRIIFEAAPKIFNFSYPIFDENYRPILQTKILKHFYTREIGLETAGLWKLKLDTKLNEIMPYYNQLYKSELHEFNPLYTVDVTTTSGREVTTDNDTSETGSASGTFEKGGSVTNTSSYSDAESRETTDGITHSGTDTVSEHPDSQTIVKESDTPQGGLTGLLSDAYLSRATVTSQTAGTNGNRTQTQYGHKEDREETVEGTSSGSKTDGTLYNTTDTNESSNSKDINTDIHTIDDYTQHVVGYEGRSAASLILEFRQTMINIDMMILDELEGLFMQLW